MALSFSRRVVTRNNTTPLAAIRTKITYAATGMRVAYSELASKTDANSSGSVKSCQASFFLECRTARSQCGHINTVRLRYHARRPPTMRTFSRGIAFSHHGHFHLGHMPSNVQSSSEKPSNLASQSTRGQVRLQIHRAGDGVQDIEP